MVKVGQLRRASPPRVSYEFPANRYHSFFDHANWIVQHTFDCQCKDGMGRTRPLPRRVVAPPVYRLPWVDRGHSDLAVMRTWPSLRGIAPDRDDVDSVALGHTAYHHTRSERTCHSLQAMALVNRFTFACRRGPSETEISSLVSRANCNVRRHWQNRREGCATLLDRSRLAGCQSGDEWNE
jgi:hypothetical protein